MVLVKINREKILVKLVLDSDRPSRGTACNLFQIDRQTAPQNTFPADARPVDCYLKLLGGVLDKIAERKTGHGDRKFA